MQSDLPKVLHSIGNLPLVGHVIRTAEKLLCEKICVVISPLMISYENEIKGLGKSVQLIVQQEQLGTAHAVLSAKDFLKADKDDGIVLVLFGDTPLLTEETLTHLIEQILADKNCALGILGMQLMDPQAYGRIILNEEGYVERIVEAKDASADELDVSLCNSGVMALRAKYALELLEKVDCNNAAKEYYLTDVVKIARAKGLTVLCDIADEEELSGVNTCADLAFAETIYQDRRRFEFLESGVKMTDPVSVYVSHDTKIGKGTVLEPNIVFGKEVTIGEGVQIRAFSRLSECRVGNGSIIGPFAHLRPGADLHDNVHVGNFVEVKKSVLHEGVKANHLSYIGDSEIGARSNIGAGTITCNYDGYMKSQTVLGEDVFIGSNSSLIAPVTIGSGSIVGAGSVIVKDVPNNTIVVARGEQKNLEGAAERFRSKKIKEKASRK